MTTTAISAPPSIVPLLEARGVVKQFGAFTALSGVDFAVQHGEIHALLGENGAGKSTLMNLLSGLLRPTAGKILRDGAPVRFASPRDAERVGIGMVHQHFLLVPPLSIRENLLLGAARELGGPLSYPANQALEEVRAIADRLGWQISWDKPAGGLPVGTQQRVEILKALRGQTSVLIFDEPTAVLTPTETPELFATIRRLAQEGRGIVFISHKLDEVLHLADHITVLRRGHVVHRTRAAETSARALAEAMVGDGAHAPFFLSPPAPLSQAKEGSSIIASPFVQRVLPTVSDSPLSLAREGQGVRERKGPSLQVENLLNGVTFSVEAGEIFGIAGVDGNGQSDLAECLAGLIRPTTGTIHIDGTAPASHALAFRRAGVVVIPADRQVRGLALSLSLTENIAFGVYDDPKYRSGPLLRWTRLRERTKNLIDRFDIRASGPDSPTGALSGGNQQKVVIARALSGGASGETPRVVVAVNPTRGLDVGAIAYVHSALRSARDAGAAVVLISTELEEIIALATRRIGVLYEGAFSGIVSPDASREEIGLLMGGSTAPAKVPDP